MDLDRRGTGRDPLTRAAAVKASGDMGGGLEDLRKAAVDSRAGVASKDVRPLRSAHGPNPIRRATPDDLDALVAIEDRSFRTDRFTRRAFRYLLSKAHAVTLVEDRAGEGLTRGYAIVLFSRGTPLARLYSIAVDPEIQGRGLGSALLQAAEQAALDQGAAYMRLEVRADAEATRAFYRSRGYRRFGIQHDYYQDGGDAIQKEKVLAPRSRASLRHVPYYAQSLDFTCGPAAVLMAMHALNPAILSDQTAELRVWRESTTIFMTSGLGGCSPEGLALACWRRGFAVDLYLSDPGIMFIDSVRSAQKREVIRLVHDDFRSELLSTGIRSIFRPLSIDVLKEGFESGGIPVVLISSYRFDASKQPHWVVITGFDQKYVYLHDPNVDVDMDKSPTDCIHVPVPQSEFLKMARYGKAHQQSALVIARTGR